MQLELPVTDEVMMEVDPEITLTSVPLTTREANNAALSSSPTSHYPLGAALSSPVHPLSMPRAGLDGGSPTLRPLPVPPVVLISSSDSAAWPKFKLDQLFVEWLARAESRQWLEGLLDDARAGKTPDILAADQSNRVSRTEHSISPGPSRSSPTASPPNLSMSPQQAPGSPVSRLFRTHIPFEDSDSSPRSPPNVPNAFISPFRPSLSTAVDADFDLGRSGSASPLVADQSSAKDDHPPLTAVKGDAPARTGTAVTLGTGGQPIDTSKMPAKPSAAQRSSSTEQRIGSPQQTLPEQVPDSKVLDRVADGIAGMTAVVDQSPANLTVSEMKVDLTNLGKADVEAQQVNASTAPRENATIFSASLGASEALGSEMIQDSKAGSPAVESRVEIGKAQTAEVCDSSSPVMASPSILASSAVPGDHRTRQREGSLPVAAAGKDTEKVPAKESQRRTREPADRLVTDYKDPSAMDEGFVSAAMPPSGARFASAEDATMVEPSSVPKKRKSLPRFYFPCGRDAESREQKERQAIKDFFKAHRVQKNLPGVSRTDIAELVVEVIGLPSYFATIIFSAIVELFPSPSSGIAKLQGQTGAIGLDDEAPMKDITQREERIMHNANPAEDIRASRNDTGGTNSDTTMGDVNDMHTEERRANGFHTRSGAHVDSTPAPPEAGNPNADGAVEVSQVSSAGEVITEEQFTSYYIAFAASASKEGRLFSALRDPLSKRDFLIPSDFKPLLRALLMCHQGLAFLHATPEFQQRYSETVIERIYFGCTRQHNGRLTLNDIKRSKLLDTLMVVDEEEDINRERKYFSYEHFYVLYCRFWELDADHDLQIDREDLMRYGSHSLTYRIVDRIFGGYARPLDCPENPGRMSYTDFIWFCLSEEDKTSDTAIDYWFRCVDMDGDGLITMFDMEFFYKEQLHRMECFGHEPVQIRDILCQLLDMINPNVQPPVIRRNDLKRCRLAGNFFNVLFNLNKFFAIEARDPLQIRQEHATPELTDWDRFAALEYLRLSAEEEGEEDESWEDVGEGVNPLLAGEAPF